MRFCLDRDGYITKYLVSGRCDSEFQDDARDSNQLRYEKYLRGLVATHEAPDISAPIFIGSPSPIGKPWRYYHSCGNIFVDDSGFYLDLRKVELLAATRLAAEEDMAVRVNLWSYAAVDVWLNGEKAVSIARPVYKPISRSQAVFQLKKGLNDVFIRLETLGVRDTSVSFALQILDRQEDIRVALPDEEAARPYVEAEDILASASLYGNEIRFRSSLPAGSYLEYPTENIDFRKKDADLITCDTGGKSSVTLEAHPVFSVVIPVGDTALRRSYERMELRGPRFLKTDGEPHHTAVMRDIAKVTSITRGKNDGFALYPLLARYFLGQRTAADRAEIFVTLRQIERRMDCADFMTCGLIRLMKRYELDDELKSEIKKTMLGFRYWMDEDGFDGMCFWSENHSLMFYETAYFFGQEYPDDIFVRSGKLGHRLYLDAKRHINEWLDDVCALGFDEFNSGTYTAITFAAILNLVDFAEKEIADKAIKAADIIMRTLARHCFKNVIISPQGRIYRDVLYPHRQSLQALLHWINPQAPYVYNEWLSALATTDYRMPEDLPVIMAQTGSQSYCTSNARIDLYKTDDYMLTSVQSPRRDGVCRTWEHRMEEAEYESFHYTKSLNECFHGTMQFEPGVYGYQQHLWYAALDQDLVVFSNHPGQNCEAKGEARPGYWYGNGITPALLQKDNVLCVFYKIPDTSPIRFIHLFWNEKKFDRVEKSASWLFGKKNDSYIGIWCSTALTDHNDKLFDCEKRAYGDQTALVCVCGSQSEDGSFADFIKKCEASPVRLERETDTLYFSGLSLHYETHRNDTQYVY